MQLALAADMKLVVIALLLGLLVVDVGGMNYNMRGMNLVLTCNFFLPDVVDEGSIALIYICVCICTYMYI